MSNLGINILANFPSVKEALRTLDELNAKANSLDGKKVNLGAKMDADSWIWDLVNPILRERTMRMYGIDPGARQRQPVESRLNQQGYTLKPPGGGGDGGGGTGGGSGLIDSALNRLPLLGIGYKIWATAKAADETYQRNAILRSGLTGRNIAMYGGAFGFGSRESYELAQQVAAETGYQGSGAESAVRNIQRFARATGTTTGFGAQMTTTWREMLNADSRKANRMLELLTDISFNTKDSPERVSRTLNSNLSLIARMQGNMAPTTSQVAGMSALTEKLWSLGPMGRSPEMMATLKGAFHPGGDRLSELLKLEMMGAYGVHDFSGLREMDAMRAEGLTTRRGREAFKRVFGRFSTNPAMQDVLSKANFPTIEHPDARRMIIDMLMSGALDTDDVKQRELQIKRHLDSRGGDPAVNQKYAQQFSKVIGTTGSDILGRRSAEEEQLDELGAKVFEWMEPLRKAQLNLLKEFTNSPVFDTFNDAAARFADAVDRFTGKNMVEGALNWFKDGSIDKVPFGRKVREYRPQLETLWGDNAPLIAAMIAAESNYKEGVVSDKGAVGLMQIVPSAHPKLTKGKNLKDPAVNVAIGKKIFKDLLVKYDGDVTKALQAYHSGSKNVDDGTLGPQGRAYVGNVDYYFEKYTGKHIQDVYASKGPGVEGLPQLIKSIDGLVDAIKGKQGNLPVRKQ